MSALNWATIAMSVAAIALSIDSIRVSRRTRRIREERTSPMTDTLRTRIAAATVGHADYVSGLTRHCTCGQWSGDSTGTRIDFSRHLADAVIRELGLRIQVAGPDGIVGTGDYRYVSDFFKADDE